MIFAATLAVFLLLPLLLRAETTLQSLFTSANNAFWNGEYQQAAQIYEELEELGVRDVVLSYNLGTAYARIGRLGKAVQQYERALKLEPGHADTRYNLQAVRAFLARRASESGRDADLAPAVGPWRAVLDRFSLNVAATIFLVVYLLLFAALTVRRFLGKTEMPRLTSGVLAGVLAVLTLAMASVVLGKWQQETGQDEAVVVAADLLTVVEGPRSEVQRFTLEEGSRVTVLEQREGWTRLRDDQGRDGWALAETLGRI
jgi:hypothetical protein